MPEGASESSLTKDLVAVTKLSFMSELITASRAREILRHVMSAKGALLLVDEWRASDPELAEKQSCCEWESDHARPQLEGGGERQ